MPTITIRVDNEQNAVLLQKMLKALTFVEDIDIQNNQSNLVEAPKGTYQKFKEAIDEIDGNLIFYDIKDPSKWQKDLRGEWEHRI